MPDDARCEARDDACLVRAARRGDEDAFRALVERYAAKVGGISYAVTGDAEAARDLVQEVFTEAFLSLRRLRSPAKFAPWVARVARLKAVGWVRARARERERRAAARDEVPVSAGDSAGESAERLETRRRVLAAVRGLPPDYREVIVLRCIDQEAPKDICRMLGISIAAMDKRLSRAKSMLREVLGDLAHSAPEDPAENQGRGEGEERAEAEAGSADREACEAEPKKKDYRKASAARAKKQEATR